MNPEELSKDKNLEKIKSVYVDLGSYGECSDARKKPAMTKHRNKQVIYADKVRTGKQSYGMPFITEDEQRCNE